MPLHECTAPLVAVSTAMTGTEGASIVTLVHLAKLAIPLVMLVAWAPKPSLHFFPGFCPADALPRVPVSHKLSLSARAGIYVQWWVGLLGILYTGVRGKNYLLLFSNSKTRTALHQEKKAMQTNEGILIVLHSGFYPEVWPVPKV